MKTMEWSFVFFFNSVLLGVGLAMDAFSVSLANGLNEPSMKQGKLCVIAGVFAFFQALMPMIELIEGIKNQESDEEHTGVGLHSRLASQFPIMAL
jgi:putative Mn2+ efflux pump MntP